MNKSSLYKGCLEPIIIHLLKTHKRMYGYEITQQVKQLTNSELSITEGALYPLLHKLEAAGMVVADMQHIGNRVRKYYSLTPEGKKQSLKYMEELQRFLATLSGLLNIKLQPDAN